MANANATIRNKCIAESSFQGFLILSNSCDRDKAPRNSFMMVSGLGYRYAN
jgi:hypothetical protein